MILRRLALAFALMLAAPAHAADNFIPSANVAKATSQLLARKAIYTAVSSVREIRPSTEKTHTIPLTLIKLAGSGWTDKLLLAEIRLAEKAYARCDASFSPITLIEAKTTFDLDELGKEPYEEMDAKWAEIYVPRDLDLVKGLKLPRPIVVYRDRGGAYSFNKMTIAGSDYYRELTDAAFVTTFAVDNNQGDAQTTAHELGHLLLNEDHNTRKGNILYCDAAGTLCEGTKLTKAQCAKVIAWAD